MEEMDNRQGNHWHKSPHSQGVYQRCLHHMAEVVLSPTTWANPNGLPPHTATATSPIDVFYAGPSNPNGWDSRNRYG